MYVSLSHSLTGLMATARSGLELSMRDELKHVQDEVHTLSDALHSLTQQHDTDAHTHAQVKVANEMDYGRFVWIFVRVCVWMYVCVCVSMYVYMYAHVSVCS